MQEIVSRTQVLAFDGSRDHVLAMSHLDPILLLGEDDLTDIIEKVDSDLALDF